MTNMIDQVKNVVDNVFCQKTFPEIIYIPQSLIRPMIQDAELEAFGQLPDAACCTNKQNLDFWKIVDTIPPNHLEKDKNFVKLII